MSGERITHSEGMDYGPHRRSHEGGRGVATTMVCSDLSGQCSAVFTTEDPGELLEHVALHAQRAHPDLELTPEVVAQAQSLMRQS
jgi:predicted small metal-binding protein